MQILARLYDHILSQSGARLTIVCATSGDTGGAAVEAFKGREHIRLVTLFPKGRISEVQRRFITTADTPNVAAVALEGDFDACQAILKGLFGDVAFAREVGLSAVNSINFVRIIAQSVYYFAAAVALGAPERAISFVTPTGNFGDAFAGWAAKQMGLSVDRILVATNRNDILARAFTQGVYERGTLRPSQSPAMDIQSASNFERLVFEASARDAASTRRAFQIFDQGGAMALSREVRGIMAETFDSAASDEAQTAAAMALAWREGLGFVDPHTAVALSAATRAGGPGPLAQVVLATAHPAKFPDAVQAAVGDAPEPPPVVARLARSQERFETLPADPSAVKAFVRGFAQA